jgi:hypothetical protein
VARVHFATGESHARVITLVVRTALGSGHYCRRCQRCTCALHAADSAPAGGDGFVVAGMVIAGKVLLQFAFAK